MSTIDKNAPQLNKYPATLRMGMLFDSASLTRPKATDEFALGVVRARHMENARVLKNIVESKSSYKAAPYVYEASLRRLKIPKPYNKVDSAIWNDVRKAHKDTEKTELREFLGTLGAVGGNYGLGKVLGAVARDDQGEQVQNYSKWLAEKDPSLAPVKWTIDSDSMASHFNPGTNHIVTGPDIAIASHEAGHAKNDAKRVARWGRSVGHVLGTAMYAGVDDLVPIIAGRLGPLGMVPVGSIAAVPLLVSEKAHQKLRGTEKGTVRQKAVDAVYNHPFKAGFGVMAPKLFEEGSASIRALNNIRKFQGAKATIGPAGRLALAFGTYATAAAIPGLAIASMRSISKAKHKSKGIMEKHLLGKQAGVIDGMFKELDDRVAQRRSTYITGGVPFADALTRRTDVGERTKVALVLQALQAYTNSRQGKKLPGVEEDKRMIGREKAEQNMGKQAVLVLSEQTMPEVYPVTVSNAKTVLNAAKVLLDKQANAPDPFGTESGGTGKFQETTPIATEVPKTKTLQTNKQFAKSVAVRGATGAMLGAGGSGLAWQFMHPSATNLPWKALGVAAAAGGAALAGIRAAQGKRPVENWNKKADHEELVHKGKDGMSHKAGTTPADVCPKELKAGIKVEREHSSDPKVQKEVALDHLTEFPNYYTALAKMEKELKKKAFSGGFTDGTAPSSSLEAMNSMAATASAPFESPMTLAAPKEIRNKRPLRNPAKLAKDVLEKKALKVGTVNSAISKARTLATDNMAKSLFSLSDNVGVSNAFRRAAIYRSKQQANMAGMVAESPRYSKHFNMPKLFMDGIEHTKVLEGIDARAGTVHGIIKSRGLN